MEIESPLQLRLSTILVLVETLRKLRICVHIHIHQLIVEISWNKNSQKKQAGACECDLFFVLFSSFRIFNSFFTTFKQHGLFSRHSTKSYIHDNERSKPTDKFEASLSLFARNLASIQAVFRY